jgi:hypothetical protein
MTKYITPDCKPVKADSIKEAAHIFARRMARREFGSRGDARTCTMGSYAEDGSLAEFSAFIGVTRGHETTGRNVNFTVHAS